MTVCNGVTIVVPSGNNVAGYVLGYTDKELKGVQISEIRPNGESTTYKIYPHRNDQVKECREKNGKLSCTTVTKKEAFARDISKTEAKALRLCNEAARQALKIAEGHIRRTKNYTDLKASAEAVISFERAVSICQDFEFYACGHIPPR